MPDRLLLLPEVAERLRLSEASVRWLLHRGGELPVPAKVGKRLVWKASTIERYLEEKFEKVGA